jgi:serine/threonine protein kinase
MAVGEEELTARIAYGDQAATILADPLATLRPSHGRLDTQEEAALQALLELAADERRGGAYETFEETLGTGAMGMVRVATQPGMGRKVAVKTLRPLHQDRAATLRLLQEAWITGALEHPNIVPVYEIAIDRDKSPQVVLRRIDGLHWRDLIRDPSRVHELYGEEDLFEWNLRVLMQVASALHFAHQRGVVHRDVKPENVMIGRFGDVYVMDWGIAVSTRKEDEGRIPVAWKVTEMAGTPAYMAPEMLDGEEPFVSARTDVYLLGATLYELVAGRAPHRGDSLMELVRSIVRSEPVFPPRRAPRPWWSSAAGPCTRTRRRASPPRRPSGSRCKISCATGARPASASRPPRSSPPSKGRSWRSEETCRRTWWRSWRPTSPR